MKNRSLLALIGLAISFALPTFAQRCFLVISYRNALTKVSFNRHAGTVPKAKPTLLSVSCTGPNYQSISRKLPTKKD
jgi:hypothetical protein